MNDLRSVVNDLLLIELPLGKAHYLCQQLCELAPLDPYSEEGKCKILLEYEQRDMFTRIIWDYVWEGLKEVKALMEKGEEALKAARTEKED